MKEAETLLLLLDETWRERERREGEKFDKGGGPMKWGNM